MVEQRVDVMRRFQLLPNMLGKHHPIKWEKVRVVHKAYRNLELKIKEALHMTLDNKKFNRE